MEAQRKMDLRRWLRSKQIPLSIIGVVLTWIDERESQEGVKVSDVEALTEAERLCEGIERLSRQIPGGERVPVELKIEKLSVVEIGTGVLMGLWAFVGSALVLGGLVWALVRILSQ